MARDKLALQFDIRKKHFASKESLGPFLRLLDKSFLPKPGIADSHAPGLRKATVKTYASDEVLGFLASKQLHTSTSTMELRTPDRSVIVVMGPGEERTSVSIFMEDALASTYEPRLVRALLIDAIAILTPRVAHCHLENHDCKLFDEHYEAIEREPWLPGLYWLSFFGNEILDEQGGKEALMANPHAQVTELPEGLLFQIGDSPFDCLTPEVEERLIAATRALPPLARAQ